MYDINESSFNRADKDYDRITRMLVKHKIYTEEFIAQRRSSMRRTLNLEEACQQADFISESVIEDIPLKKKVWSDIGKLTPAECILTTNTSYLLPSYFAQETGNPSMFCAFHFHDVFTARVVDIMPHPSTDSQVIPLLKEVGVKLNQIPVVIKKETHGYLFNKMFGTILLEAGKMWAAGLADHEDIDRSWIGNFGMRIGPFGMIDEVGLDTLLHVSKIIPDSAKDAFLSKVQEKVDAGELGIKSGKGFYTYPNPAYKAKDFLIG